MVYIADLHVHSHHSYATSKHLDLWHLHYWARVKGIDVVGTGDFTHPGWCKTLKEWLVPDGSGFFRFKDASHQEELGPMRPAEREVRFCLSAEVSCVYHSGGKLRKSHHLLYAPDLETVEQINMRLCTLGNLSADGRPTLRVSARDLLEIVLSVSERAHLIPAHIWTPWFAILGARSGYNGVEACFRDLAPHIFALETGLSSDPAMNWQISALDRYTMVSNSDAHSPSKLGREANILDTERSYDGMFAAFKTQQGFLGTLEFFPQEGKYHLDGHRRCGICLYPEETKKYKGICPVCGRGLTIGVLHRVSLLADRKEAVRPKQAAGFSHIVPLQEIIAQLLGRGVATKGVMAIFTKIINLFGSEFDFLRTVPLIDITRKIGVRYALAIEHLRTGQVQCKPGFDGLFGEVSMLEDPPPVRGKLLGI